MSQRKLSIQRPSIKQVKEIFPSATGTGLILPEIQRGLVIQFNQCADLFGELKMSEPCRDIKSKPLFHLVQKFGFVVLKNCKAVGVQREGLARLSHGRNAEGLFIQDPFHYDYFPGKENFVAGICQMTDEGREEDTLYALESDVRKAIGKLDKRQLSDETIQALNQMTKENYGFRLKSPFDIPARMEVRDNYPSFVEDVFALIPEGRKYRKKWLKGQWDIAMDANIFGDILHARPTGRYVAMGSMGHNPLCGLNILNAS